MKISYQLGKLQTALETWVDNYEGSAVICSDLNHMWNMATAKSDAPRVLIVYHGEDPRGEFGDSQFGRVDRTFLVAITRGRGFTSIRGATVVSFVDVLEEAREIIRSQSIFEPGEQGVDYKGMIPMQLGDLIIDGYLIQFSVGSQIERIAPFAPTQTA